jgi:predicted lipoprotein
MKWLSLSPCLLALIAGCDKTVPFENTAPAKAGTMDGGATFPSIDAGLFFPSDAQVARDGAMAAIIPPEPFTKPALLKQIADCSLTRFKEFNELASALQAATSAFAANPSDATRSAAQDAWRVAMSSWEQAELFGFGPAGPSNEPGGQDGRSSIYFYPDINTCLIDQQILNMGYGKLASAAPGVKGLGALEYLLWKSDAGNSCSPSLAINVGNPSPWQKLDPATLQQRRAEYAKAAADDLALHAKALFDAWDPAGGNFHETLRSAGAPGNVFATDQAAFNAINIAMFYLDKQFKDDKLGIPAGISMDCPSTVCPQLVESPYAQASNDDLRQNLHAFRSLFQGCGGDYSGLGFDDWLTAIGRQDVRDNMIRGLDQIEQQLGAFDQPLSVMVQAPAELPAVVATHASVVTFANIMKGDYRAALNIELPMAALGDND